MITKTVLTTLVFALIISFGAAAYALINPGMSQDFQANSSFSYGYHGDQHHDDDDDD